MGREQRVLPLQCDVAQARLRLLQLRAWECLAARAQKNDRAGAPPVR